MSPTKHYKNHFLNVHGIELAVLIEIGRVERISFVHGVGIFFDFDIVIDAVAIRVGGDMAFQDLREGGVTTVNTGPGSANLIGGQFACIKTKPASNIDDVVIILNPAEIIGVADGVGSLEVGKDADLVIFSAHPFDYRSTCETVMIDGEIVYRNVN